MHKLPRELDLKVAALKLQAMNISIDQLSAEQIEYLQQA
ncbi:adenosylhomocysteinase [Anaerospora sp.]|nr:hypothetical protein [Anaerospora sp.]